MKTLCRKLKLTEEFDFKQLARLTPGYVGADLMALCREAAMCAVNRVLLRLRKTPQSHSLPQSASEEMLTSKEYTRAELGQLPTDINSEAQEKLGQDYLQV